MKKLICLILTVLLSGLCFLTACEVEDAVLDEEKEYEISRDISSLDVGISAAEFVIREGDAFALKSNLKFLSVAEENGKLRITDKAPAGSNYMNATLTLTVPEGKTFSEVELEIGAARLTADKLSAEALELRLGAGDVSIGYLEVSQKADIEGGTGKITVSDGSITDLTVEMGVGKLEFTAAVLGEGDFELGVGESSLTLKGSKDDYKIDVRKGIGTVTVDGVTVTDFGTYGDGENYINIEGGVGAVNISFKED